MDGRKDFSRLHPFDALEKNDTFTNPRRDSLGREWT